MKNGSGKARHEGRITRFYPADFALPMAAPRDLGEAAADFLLEPVDRTGLRYIQGPQRCTPRDEAMAAVVGRLVQVKVAPRSDWQHTFEQLGLSESAARSCARMTAITLDDAERPEAQRRGRTTLRAHFEGVVRRSSM